MRTTTLALFVIAALGAGAAAADLPAQATPGDVLQRAQILAARQSWADAAAAFKDAIAANPKDAVLYNRLGICYQRMGDLKAARAAYRTAT
jgi:Flp pilus assembly protein TadD